MSNEIRVIVERGSNRILEITTFGGDATRLINKILNEIVSPRKKVWGKSVADSIRYLILNGFFDETRTFSEIEKKLIDLGVDFKSTSLGSILHRCLVKNGELKKICDMGYIRDYK